MKLFQNVRFRAGLIGVVVIILAGIIAGKYYGARLPLETPAPQETPAQTQ